MPTIKLQSSDGVTFEVDMEVASFIGTIKAMMEDLGMCEEGEVIPLPNVKSATLSDIITWATHHYKNDSPVAAAEGGQQDVSMERRTDDISPWDQEFLKVDQKTLFDLLLASNYLDIKGLSETISKTIANMIKGKTSEEIREMFQIKNDFSKGEEAQIRKENEWCMEK